jgi:hypothetical protein
MAKLLGNFKLTEIDRTYFDTVTVYRKVSKKQDNGSTKMVKTIIYEEIPCAYSIGTRPSLNSITEDHYRQQDAVNRIRTQHRLFCNPSYLIQQGDELQINANGRTIIATSGEPFVYPAHQHMHVQEIRYA